jgi:uncharacterized protein (TIGR00369 family)
MASLLEKMQRMVRGEIPQPPVGQLIGFRLTAVERDRATFEMEADAAKHGNPLGTVHGGVFCDILDAAMGIAWASALEEGESFTTLELKTNFLKPVFKSKLKAVGSVVKRGRTVGMVEAELFDEKGSLVAKASSTCLTLRGEQAKGR